MLFRSTGHAATNIRIEEIVFVGKFTAKSLACNGLSIQVNDVLGAKDIVFIRAVQHALPGVYIVHNAVLSSFLTDPLAIAVIQVFCLCDNIPTNKAAIGGIVNVVALGTSFLCGCFVPFEYMPDYVLKIAHILPTYYFVANNQLIKTIESFNIDTLKPIFINVGVVLAFTIVFVILSNYISKKKQRV